MLYDALLREVKRLNSHVDGLYIYGAGYRGRDIYHILLRNNVIVDGFLVTNVGDEKETLGHPILAAKDMIHKNIGIIIGVGDDYAREVMKYLSDEQVDPCQVIDGGCYLNEERGSKTLQENPILEITTVVGCRVNCTYCPQDLLIQRYYENNPKRDHTMTLTTFKKILKNTPDNCIIMFAGMAEPFLAPDCLEMLQTACDAGREVRLYTTLEGIQWENLNEVLSLPLQYVNLHVADENGDAKIKTDDLYYRKVEKVITAKKENGDPFVNTVSAQGTPPPRIMEICKGHYEILVSLQDRAGNLQGQDMARRNHCLHDERIECCLVGPKLDMHVVLPDGTLLLCDNDYGMEHVLGNLVQDTLEHIREGNEMKRVWQGVSGDEAVDLLCRKCIFAMVKEQ